MHFLSSLEHSPFGTWVREAPTIWAYATILFLHTIGLGFVVINLIIDMIVALLDPRIRYRAGV